MAPAKMPLRADEEMGKKDDDHRPIDTRFRSLRHRAISRPRRIIIGLVILALLYEFFKHMPTDLAPAVERYNPAMAKLRQETLSKSTGSDHSPTIPRKGQVSQVPVSRPEQKEEGYDGDVMFPELERSFPRYKYSGKTSSHVVLFAASSLRSVSDLVPLACRMADQPFNYVHFILMGKETIPIQDIKEVNGIRDKECPLTWHVGRPDLAPESIDARMERAVKGGLQLVQTFINPEVIITQGENWEDSFFWNGVEAHSRGSDTPHIALPSASRDLMWIASLDSAALRTWNKIHIEMVVHAPSESGSLIRLLKSLDAADYLGSTPSLTIELPQQADPQLLHFLQQTATFTQLSGHITLRRRIQPHHMDSAESSLRTVESFYPLDPETSHLLLLSPQAELGPSFYHYLKYTVLNYKQSARAKSVFSKLIGISLELPFSSPTADGKSFAPPEMTVKDKEQLVPSFLWQAPSSNAALYFGDVWAEFHSFMSNRLSTPESVTAPHTKLISERYPAFMEQLLEMIRAKGYYLLYPSFPGIKSSSIATIHDELYQHPEEFGATNPSVDERKNDPIGLGSGEQPLSHASNIMALLDLFPSGLPDLDALPLLGFNGEQLDATAYSKQTEEYLQQFRIYYGGCAKDTKTDDPSADLFCLQE